MRYAVIMAGGSGTRFWPESRNSRPKQFLKIAGDEAMITLTAQRLLSVTPPDRIFVVTHASQARLASDCLAPLGIPRHNIIPEPLARNTAAAVGLAARILAQLDPEAVFAVLPADHVIHPADRFHRTLEESFSLAENGGLYTFGIRPDFPSIGYGYIEMGAPIETPGSYAVHRIESFKEKPGRTQAEAFLAQGCYVWNSGMFVWRAREILEEIRAHCPELGAGLAQLPIDALPASWGALPETLYGELPALPIDMAVMEHSDRGYVMPVDYDWNDVGSWDALDELHPADERENRSVFPAGGRLLVEDARGILGFSSSEHMIAVIGLEDLVVVHSEGATLVAPKSRCEEVKKIVEQLRSEGQEKVL